MFNTNCVRVPVPARLPYNAKGGGSRGPQARTTDPTATGTVNPAARARANVLGKTGKRPDSLKLEGGIHACRITL